MADAEDENNKAVVLERTNEAVVSDPVFPELTQSALQSFPDSPRIVEFSDTLAEKLQNSAGDGFIEFLQFLLGCPLEFNPPTP